MSFYWNDEEREPRVINILLTIVLSMITIALLFSSIFIVRDGTVAVLTTLGKYSDDEVLPGAHMKWPIVQGIIRQDVKVQTVNYKGNIDRPDREGIVNKPSISVLDEKNLPIQIELTVQYIPIKSRVADLLREVGVDYFEKKVNPLIRDVVRDIAASYGAEDIARKRTEMGEKITAALTNAFKSHNYFILANVNIRHIALPESVAKKIREVQEQKQEEQKLQMREKQAVVTKRIQIINARREAEKRIIEAKASAERKKIAAQAEAYRISIVAKSRSEANKKISASLSPILIRNQHIRKWNGQYPRTMLGGKEQILLNLK